MGKSPEIIIVKVGTTLKKRNGTYFMCLPKFILDMRIVMHELMLNKTILNYFPALPKIILRICNQTI